MHFLYLIFYSCLRLRFLDVETNPDLHRPEPAVCRILCSNVQGLAGNLSDLTVACLSTIYCFALRLWSQIRVGGAGSRFRPPCFVVSGQDASGQ